MRLASSRSALAARGQFNTRILPASDSPAVTRHIAVPLRKVTQSI
jgi:hypothetical protein